MEPDLSQVMIRSSHSLLCLCSAAFGSALLYSKWGKGQLRPYVFADIVDTFAFSETSRIRVEFIVFVMVGMVTCMLLTHPANTQQAFAAGLGWTGLLTEHPSKRANTRRKV